ncbi:RRXRR domain-containing protein [Acidithiobacillus sp. MC6.1]|nr:RRXRR domain-containing protein [Acidithiobacillus sp. MC6.1]
MQQNSVLVLDKNRQPLMPCHPARARELLRKGKAAVFRRYPFTLILKEREGGATQPTTLKADPGSKTTGLALVAECAKRGSVVVWAAELVHRGYAISLSLKKRHDQRHSRRNRKTRYRAPRFDHRTRPAGWLPPSIAHRVLTTLTWFRRTLRWVPVTRLSFERVKFDMQAMQNPEISGVEYQQGELFGYEVREYLLEKWGRQCTYCDAENVPLEIDHIHPRSLGGSDRVSNLAIACHDCNQEKDSQPLNIFLATGVAPCKGSGRQKRFLTHAAAYAGNDTKKMTARKKWEEDRMARVSAQAKSPLKDAAAVNATRNRIFEALSGIGLPVETGSGGRTKFNRTKQQYPKAHWIDAACVGESGTKVHLIPDTQVLQITANGHGSRRMCNVTKYGFPRGMAKSHQKIYFGFQTGDMVRAVVPKGKRAGVHVGRVACRKSGSFDITTKAGKQEGISYRYCQPIHRQDGYSYAY